MNNHQKNLLITTDFPPDFGGVANYWANLSFELAKVIGEDNYFVLAPEISVSDKFDITQNYIIFRKKMDKKSWPKWWPILTESWKVIKKKKIQHLFVTQILPVGTVALILKFFLNIKYSISIHGLDLAFAQKSKRKSFLARIILKNAEKIIANSQFTARKIVSFDKSLKNKIITVYPCPNYFPTEISKERNDEFLKERSFENKQLILSVGRLVERKGFDLMIKAMPLVLQKFPKAIYAIYGDGQDESRLRELIKQKDLQNSIFIFDKEKKENLPLFFANSEIFVMPCRERKDGDVEGFGIVYLEANLFGKPAIAGNSGGAPEAVLDTLNGFVVDPQDELDLAGKVIQLLENPELAQKMGEFGKKRVLRDFTWEKQARKLLK
ncbi:MAG: glycosyltransferase family 4 protein [Patescibacteria group bacterium]